MSLPYRLGVGILLLNSDRKIFIAQRIDMRAEAWQMPQGGIDEGEDPKTAAMRELGEEIGTNNAEIIAESKDWLTYDLPEALVPEIWGGKYRGQCQKWFAMRFLGKDSEINLETEHPEFLRWQWAEPAQVPLLIVPFKQALYRQILQEFAAIL